MIIKDESDFSLTKILSILGAGAVGALAYTFSNTFWFSAVESEVYAFSSLFTAVVFWCILRWEDSDDKGKGLPWIVLIAYLMGLSIGVHLLNLLAIPAIILIYYYRRRKSKIQRLFCSYKPSTRLRESRTKSRTRRQCIRKHTARRMESACNADYRRERRTENKYDSIEARAQRPHNRCQSKPIYQFSSYVSESRDGNV